MSKLNKKKLDEFGQKVLKNFEEKEKIRSEHHIVLWLLLFPPVGIYKSIKYKGFSKFINFIFILIFVFLISLLTLILVNPYDLRNTRVEKILNDYEKYGEVLEYKLVDELQIADSDYYVYECVTKLGIYNVYLNRDEDFRMDYVYSFQNRSVILDEKILNDYKHQLYNEIFLFFQNEEHEKEYGKIEGLLTKTEAEEYTFEIKDENLEYQGIKTSKGNYIIGCLYNQVVQIMDLDDNNKIIYQQKPNLRLPNKTLSRLKSSKNKEVGTIQTVYGFEWSSEGSYYYFINTEGTVFQLFHNYEDKYILNWGDKGDTTEEAYKDLLEYINTFENFEEK